MLGVLVIVASILLGTLVGWRLGWRKATLGLRGSSPPHRIDAPSKTAPTDHTVLPVERCNFQLERGNRVPRRRKNVGNPQRPLRSPNRGYPVELRVLLRRRVVHSRSVRTAE